MPVASTAVHGFVVADVRGLVVRGQLVGGDLDLRPSSLTMDPERFEADRLRHEASLALNEDTLAPRAFRQAGERFTISFAPSTYAHFRAAADQFAHIDEVHRTAALATGPQWTFTHTFGVDMTLETSDGRLVFTRRSSKTVRSRQQLAPAMNEGSHLGDVVNGAWDPMTTAYRGFHEELNLNVEDFVGAMEFHTVIAQLHTGALSLLGHARTALTAEQVVDRHQDAEDQWEAEELLVIDDTAAARSALHDLGPDAWVDWGLPALAGLCGRVYNRR